MLDPLTLALVVVDIFLTWGQKFCMLKYKMFVRTSRGRYQVNKKKTISLKCFFARHEGQSDFSSSIRFDYDHPWPKVLVFSFSALVN